MTMTGQYNDQTTTEKRINNLIGRLCSSLERRWIELGELNHWEEYQDKLVAFGEIALQPLINALLTDDSRNGNYNCAETLGKMGDPRAVSALTKTLTHSDEWTRMHAAKALRRIGSESATPALIKAMTVEDEWVGVQVEVLRALGKTGGEGAFETIVSFIRHKKRYGLWSLRKLAAVQALGYLKDERSFDILIKLLKRDRTTENKCAAAFALGCLDDPRAVYYVDEIINKFRYPSCAKAEKMLRDYRNSGNELDEITLQSHIDRLNDKDETVRVCSAIALGEIGSEIASPDLIEVLKDEAPIVQVCAMRSLGKIGGDKAFETIRSFIDTAKKGEDYSHQTRAAIHALGYLNYWQSFNTLSKLLDSEKYGGTVGNKCAIAFALGCLGNEDVEFHFEYMNIHLG